MLVLNIRMIRSFRIQMLFKLMPCSAVLAQSVEPVLSSLRFANYGNAVTDVEIMYILRWVGVFIDVLNH